MTPSGYRIVFGSDVQERDGTFVELASEPGIEPGAWVEFFRSDVDGAMTFSAETRDLPLEVFEACLGAGYREFARPTDSGLVVDLRGVADWREVDRRWAEAARFPDWYGFNKDAWIDCMTSLDSEGHPGFLAGPAVGPVVVQVVTEDAPPGILATLVMLCGDVNHHYAEAGSAVRLDIRFRGAIPTGSGNRPADSGHSTA